MLKRLASIMLLAAMLFTASCAGNTANELKTSTAASGETVNVSAAAFTYFYNDIVLSYLNHYSAVLDKLGLDPSVPLAQQKMPNSDNTWRDYFMKATSTMTYHLISFNEAAKAEGISLTDAEINAIKSHAATVATGTYGTDIDTEAIIDARLIEALAYKYQEIKETEFEPTLEEIEAYISENKQDFKYDETGTWNLRAIMLFDTSFQSHEDALNKANELMTVLQDDASAKAFTLLALEYSDDPSSCYAGGLYPNLAPNKSIKEIDKWCFDASRKVGDLAVVESDYGCHIVYIESEGLPVWQAEISAEMVSERFYEFSDTIYEKYPVSFDEEALAMIK